MGNEKEEDDYEEPAVVDLSRTDADDEEEDNAEEW